MSSKSVKLKTSEKVAYGFGDSAANIYVAMAGTFLTGYYTDSVGVSAAAIGTMMLLTRILDGGTDILMGALVDKTKSKYGKARPWLLWTAPLMAIGLISLFSVPENLSETGKMVYIYITYILMNCVIYTANNLPYNALLSRMTLDVQDRTSAASVRFLMTQVTTLIISFLTTGLLASQGWQKLAIIYGVAECIMLLICFYGTKEHVGDATNEAVKEIVPFKDSFNAVLKNKYFFIQSILFAVFFIGIVANGMLGYFYATAVMNNIAFVPVTTMCATIPMIIVTMITPTIARKYGKRKIMSVGAILMILGSIVVGAAGTNYPIVVTGLVVKGFGMGGIQLGIFAMTADVVDYGEWKTNIRSEGLVNSCTSFGMKVGIGLGSAVGTMFLSMGGYDGMAATQAQSAIDSISFGFGYFGAIIGAASFVLIYLMNIDKHIEQIQKDLEAKHYS